MNNEKFSEIIEEYSEESISYLKSLLSSLSRNIRNGKDENNLKYVELATEITNRINMAADMIADMNHAIVTENDQMLNAMISENNETNKLIMNVLPYFIIGSFM